MNITEEQKQEAEESIKKYLPMVNTKDFFGDSVEMRNATKCAIQDRQSVLDALQKAYNIGNVYNATCGYIYGEIQYLNAQITYLKSKI